MTHLDLFSAFILVSLLLTTVAILIVVARTPGRVARDGRFVRSHTITIAGWAVALLCGAVGVYLLRWL